MDQEERDIKMTKLRSKVKTLKVAVNEVENGINFRDGHDASSYLVDAAQLLSEVKELLDELK